ncbi:hypothetical protein MLD38_006248 [Melastoma candidum]|uniref:Uncharacterized protein n=1 Tax=Melastoma candidum TaxID=119954 RepID=A0ACB9RR06_9MYRT|nr:hypothetical protein MLD38_006248 [Melastoma candidum]
MGILPRIIVLVLGLSGLAMCSASVGPDTTLQDWNCSILISKPGESNYANSVEYVLDDMATVTASCPGYDYHTWAPYPTFVAYSHSTCNPALTVNDCITCATTAKTFLKMKCLYSLAAEMYLKDCSMSYSRHPM